jgi:hypothetical protein
VKIFENLRNLPHAPSVPISTPTPAPLYREQYDEDADADTRFTRMADALLALSCNTRL